MPKQGSLIVAYLLDGKGGGKEIGWDEIDKWTPEQGLLWVHLNYTARRTAQWLNQKSGLDKIIAKAMVLEETRPRSLIEPNGVMACLRGVNLNPAEDPEDMVSIRVWIDEHRIISTRRRRLLSVDDIRMAIKEGRGPKTSAEFLKMLNERLIDRMSDVLETIDNQVDLLEEEVITAKSYLLRPKIADIRRQSIQIRRYLIPQRDALNRLAIEETPLLTPVDRMAVREATDRIARYIENLDSARERASITQEELSSRLSEQMESRMYLLSIVAVIFLPLSFITGLLGINVGGIPGADYKWAFLMVSLFLGGVMFILLWIFRRKKWI